VTLESQDRDLGRVRLEEEVANLKKRVEEAEGRAKKFESRYRQAVREAEDVREQMSSMQMNSQVINIEDDTSSMSMFNGPGFISGLNQNS
jgi:hypothetical protein